MVCIDHSDQRPEWKLLPADGVPGWWPWKWSDGSTSAAAPARCDALGCVDTLGAQPRAPACPLPCAEENKPFTQPGKRNLPRLVTNTPVLLCSTYLCFSISGAKHTWAYGYSLIFLCHPELLASCFPFWSLYRPTALSCVCSSSPAQHGAAQVAVRRRWLLRKGTLAPLMSAHRGAGHSKAGTVMWMLLTVMVHVFHNTWSWWQLSLQHLSWPSCCDGGAEWFCQGRNSLFSKLLVLFLEKTNEVLVLYTFTLSFLRG